MTNQQMELGLGSAQVIQRTSRPSRRLSRGRWWFEQMRQVVDSALDWQSAPPARPEQIWLSGTQRHARV